MNAVPVLPIWYVIATRVWRGNHFRTRYFIECYDGRPRVGSKVDGSRFGETEAATVCAHLNATTPLARFVAFDDTQRPPKAWEGIAPPAQAHQANIDDIEGDAGVPSP